MLFIFKKYFFQQSKFIIPVFIMIIINNVFPIEKPVFSLGFQGEVKTQNGDNNIISDFPSSLTPDGYKESLYLKYKQIFFPEFYYVHKIVLQKNHRYQSYDHETTNYLMLRLYNTFNLKPADFFSSGISINYERKTKDNNVNNILEDKIWFPLFFKWTIWQIIEYKTTYNPQITIKKQSQNFNQEIKNDLKCSFLEKRLIIKANYDLLIKNINNTDEKLPYLIHKLGTEITYNFK